MPGELRRSPEGAWTFVPARLPPAIEFTGALVRGIAEAERALGELAALSQLLPNARLLLNPFLRREAVLSSKIEGTVTRLDQLLLFEAQPDEDESPADIHEVLNYVRALDYGLERLRADMPLCLRLLRELHAHLMDGVRGGDKNPGEFRRCPVLIGQHGQDYERARFVPPHHTELTPLLRDLESFLHRPGDLPLVVQLALAHYQFEAIHPFMDGNGRIGRLLITLMLCERGALPEPLLYFSAYLEAHNDEYRDHLLHISQRAAWSDWIAFFSRGVTEQSRDAVLRAQRLIALQGEFRERMHKVSQSSAALRLVDHLFTAPYVTAPGVARLLDLSPKAARQNIDKLRKQDILREVDPTRQRHRLYFAPRIVKLLEMPAMPTEHEASS